MKRQKFLFALFLFSLAVLSLRAELRVASIQAKSGFPWNGKVAITIQVDGTPIPHSSHWLTLAARDNATGSTLQPKTLSEGRGNVSAAGTYTLEWDAAADYPEYYSDDLQIVATLEEYTFEDAPTYLVIDLSGGSSAARYPCHFTNFDPDLSGDACRTTELWLRRIPAGTFVMGSPADELGRKFDETQHQVTLTRDYYVGVFEVTQRQYELVTGSNPSRYKGDTRPVEVVSYDDLRGTSAEGGAGWPAKGHAVDAGSFFGVLRAKTGLTFDLPTEAQWEYACRAGTTTALNSGKNLTATDQCPNMAQVGRYDYNRSDGKGGYSPHTRVGSYLPNAWGLYDMHGNVYEWCLDWRGSYPTAAVADPAGASSGSYRVERGGSWFSHAQSCRSAHRSDSYPSLRDGGYGFRVVCLP